MHLDLFHTPTLFLDCQTTGSNPDQSHLLELGWGLGTARSEIAIHSSLLRLPEGAVIPRAISQLTGITDDMTESGTTAEIVMTEIQSTLAKSGVPERVLQSSPKLTSPCVMHFARFEQAFIGAWLPDATSGYPVICTYEIARRLFPDLPSRSLRALSGFLGFPISNLKRSAHHVEATIIIWRELLKVLQDQEGLQTFEDLTTWLQETPVPKAGRKQYGVADTLRLNLPDQPGIYQMLNQRQDILYVGKATSLKSRVNSYFRGRQSKGSRLNEMIAQIKDIKVQVCANPIEAALVESDLIKRFDPPYNRALKAGQRQLAYLTHDHEITEDPAKGAWGPFGSRSLLDASQILREALIKNIPPQWDWFELEEEIVTQGLALFRQQFPFDAAALKSWERILLSCWKLRENEASEVVEEVDEDADDEPSSAHILTPESFCRLCVHTLAGVARRAHRSRWLTWMLESVILWRTEAGQSWQQLTLVHGESSWSQHERRPRKVAPPPYWQDSLSRRRPLWDVPIYDRLNILVTELGKLMRAGAEVRITLDPHRTLDEKILEKFLFPGSSHAHS